MLDVIGVVFGETWKLCSCGASGNNMQEEDYCNMLCGRMMMWAGSAVYRVCCIKARGLR